MHKHISFAFLFLAFFFGACGDSETSAGIEQGLSEPVEVTGSSSIVKFSSSSFAKSSSSSKVSSNSRTVLSQNPTECEFGTLLDERDGQTYKTIKIGDQVWMAENLNYEMDSSFCYMNSLDSCEKYGRLYTYYTADEACPAGYHLPTREEFAILMRPLSERINEKSEDWSYYMAPFALKATEGWEPYTKPFHGDVYLPASTNATCFTALPAGYRMLGPGFKNAGRETYFWCRDDHSEGLRIAIDMSYDTFFVTSYWWDDNEAFSVRCIKD